MNCTLEEEGINGHKMSGYGTNSTRECSLFSFKSLHDLNKTRHQHIQRPFIKTKNTQDEMGLGKKWDGQMGM